MHRMCAATFIKESRCLWRRRALYLVILQYPCILSLSVWGGWEIPALRIITQAQWTSWQVGLARRPLCGLVSHRLKEAEGISGCWNSRNLSAAAPWGTKGFPCSSDASSKVCRMCGFVLPSLACTPVSLSAWLYSRLISGLCWAQAGARKAEEICKYLWKTNRIGNATKGFWWLFT